MNVRFFHRTLFAPAGALALAAALTVGCDNKETLLDVNTPGGGVEVERDRDTGAVDVDVHDNERILDVDAPGTNVEVTRGSDGLGVNVEAD